MRTLVIGCVDSTPWQARRTYQQEVAQTGGAEDAELLQNAEALLQQSQATCAEAYPGWAGLCWTGLLDG